MEKDWTWSLKELYESFEDPAFKKDLEDAEKEVQRVRNWAKENFASRDGEERKIEEYIKISQGLERFMKLMSFSSLSLSVNTEDAAAIKSLDILRRLFTEMTDPNVAFEKYVASCEKLEEYIKTSPLLGEHAFYLRDIKENDKYQLSEKEESLLSKLANTGSGAWYTMKEQLASTLTMDVEIEGEKKALSLSMIRNLARDDRQAVRKLAWETELESYKKIDRAVAASLNAIKGEVLTVSKLRGYESPLDMTVKQARMDMPTLAGMLEAMKEYLPVFHKFFKKKAAMLGHKNGLPWYDIIAPVGEAKMKFTIEEAADFIVKNFNDFSSRLGGFARHAFDNRWIDVYPRKGKGGGAFCSRVPLLRESRILTNYDDTFDAVSTLAHELGHGYHNYCLREASVLNTHFTMPIAETASTFCETLICRAAIKTATPAEALVIRENDISGNAQIIVDIYSRFLFEDELFRRRVKGPLTVDELNALMLDCQKQAYGDGLDHSCLNSGMWVNKVHYYYASRNYYNFPYAYGQLFALGLYARFLETGSAFVDKYDALLVATGKNKLADIGRLVNIDVTKKDFWVSSLEIIEKEIEEFCAY
jgi:pepF/M3 family oligoendopeptidase